MKEYTHTHTHTHTRHQQLSQFKQIPSKEKSKFIKFDTVDFYPSVTEELLIKSLNYAKSTEAIDENIVKVILHSRSSLLFDREDVWVKKENPNFDTTMGSYDVVELSELNAPYILNLLSGVFGK